MLSWASQQIDKLSEKVAPPPTDASGRFVYCMQRNDEEGALAALQEMPDPSNTIVQQAKGCTAIHVACQASSARVIRHLLLQPGASLQVLDNVGNTPLHYACMSNSRDALAVVKMLVTEFKASVVAKNGENKTPYDLAASDGVRQYLLPLQLQQETQNALDNGGVGLPPGIDLGGLRLSNTTAPPPISAPPPTTPGAYHHASSMLTTPSPSSATSAPQPSPMNNKPPMAPPSSGNREYARTGSSSAAIYTGGTIKPDGFHSSSSDRNLQKLYNHQNVQTRNVAPPPTSGGSSAPPPSYNPYANRRARYPVYDVIQGRTVTPPHSGNYNNGAVVPTPPHSGNYNYNSGGGAVPTPPHSGNVFNPASVAGANEKPRLPHGWTEAIDPTSGRTYYVNAALNKTSWELPTAAEQPAAVQTVPTPNAQHVFAGPSPEKQTSETPEEETTNGQKTPEDPLAPGWTQVVDPTSGRPYYHNAAQNITTWERPTVSSKGATEPNAEPRTEQLFANPSPEKKQEEDSKEPTEETAAVDDTKAEKEDINGHEEPQVPVETELPQGWTEVVDPTSGRSYYHHAAQNITTWERPTNESAPVEKSAEPTSKAAEELVADPTVLEQQAAEVQSAESTSKAEEVVAAPTVEQQAAEEQNEETTDKTEIVSEEPKTEDEKEEPKTEVAEKEDINGHVEPKVETELPQGWTEVVDPTSGRSYYHHAAQNITTWERPTHESAPVEQSAEPTSKAEEQSAAPTVEQQVAEEQSAESTSKAEELVAAPTVEQQAAEEQNEETTAKTEIVSEEPKTEVEKEGVSVQSDKEATSPAALPEGWSEAVDPSSGRSYYHNTAQNITTWERPTVSAESTPSQPEKEIAASELPEGWAEVVDPTSGRTYYFNAAQNITTWERPAAPESSTMPAPQALAQVQSVSSTASAHDVFASPAQENKKEAAAEAEQKSNAKPDLPGQRSITEETARSSSSSAAELFATPAVAETTVGSSATDDNVASTEEPKSNEDVADAEPVENTEELVASNKDDPVVANGSGTGLKEETPPAVTGELNDDSPDGSMEEMMSEVPLDETPQPSEPQQQQSQDTGPAPDLFSAIGMPPPPFRSS